MKTKTIIVLATLDTKGQEAQLVKEEIEKRSYKVANWKFYCSCLVLFDLGVRGCDFSLL